MLLINPSSESGSTTTGDNDITGIVEPDPDEMDDVGESSRTTCYGGQLKVSDGTLSRLGAVYIFHDLDLTFLRSRMDCIICGDPIRHSQRFYAPCSHCYCRGCLVNL